jgi:hypothetical protein
MNGFIGYYGPKALAYWTNPISFNTKQTYSGDILDFTRMHAGGKLDSNYSFQRLNLEGEDYISRKKKFTSINEGFNRWKEWFLSKSKSSINSPEQGLSKSEYINFLKKQNSRPSIEMALLLDSSDQETLKLYGENILARSQAVGLSEQEKVTLQKRAKWYLEKASLSK